MRSVNQRQLMFNQKNVPDGSVLKLTSIYCIRFIALQFYVKSLPSEQYSYPDNPLHIFGLLYILKGT